MPWAHATLWGLFGGFAVEGLDLYTALRRRGHWPWRSHERAGVGLLGYLVAEFVRLFVGGGLAWAAAASGQITSAGGALAVGVAAPLIVERLAQALPLTGATATTAGATTAGAIVVEPPAVRPAVQPPAGGPAQDRFRPPLIRSENLIDGAWTAPARE